MTKRILIDAEYLEETRVVVTNENNIEDFDHETTTKKQNRGNLYLAKIARVEPSLQAAFVEKGTTGIALPASTLTVIFLESRFIFYKLRINLYI